MPALKVTAAGCEPGHAKEARHVSTSRSRQQQRQNARNQARTAGAAERRQEKRAQFETPRRRTGLHIALAAAALVVVAVVAAVAVSARTGGETATATVAPAGGDVTIPVAEVSDGKAHFYTYDAGGTQVKYFVLASGDGELRVALDACEVCYPQKKGYSQAGDAMQCNNCGQVFAADKINVVTGGCNPIPVERSVSGPDLQIAAASLTAGAPYFQ